MMNLSLAKRVLVLKWVKFITLGGMILITWIGMTGEIWKAKYEGKIYPGVKIVQKEFGEKIILENGKEWIITKEEIGLRWNEEKAKEEAYKIGRSGNYVENWKVIGEAIRSSIEIKAGLIWEEEQLDNKIKEIAGELFVEPVEPRFTLKGTRVEEFMKAKAGQKLDQEEAKKLVVEGLRDQKEMVKLVIQVLKPKVSGEIAQAERMGLREILGEGISFYRRSITSRRYNIGLVISRANGLLVPPGEIVSFNATIGDVSKETGYKESYIIKDGQTILGDGGGVCQGSTTMFRAILAAGLPIIERRAHSYRVGYYEQNFQMGKDATVYAPSTDLKFKNDTGHYILIQAITVPKISKVVIKIWGTNDGRRIDIGKTIISSTSPALPDEYIDDPNLAPGEIKQIDWSAPGAKVSFLWKVIRGDEILQDRWFYSNYQPWSNKFLRGI
jgi:vancomycin resistance protein YoaR